MVSFSFIIFPPNYILHIILILSRIFAKNLGGISHNVPAVYDGFLCPIKEMRSISRAQKTVGGVWRGNERSE
jgi:hypothetical protein